MKKLILLVIMILIVTFGITNNVNALSYDYIRVGQIQVLTNKSNQSFNFADSQVLNKTQNINFNTNITNTTSNFVRFTYMGNFNNKINYETLNNSTWYKIVNDYNFVVYLINSNGEWPLCEMESGFIVCPLINGNTYTGLRFQWVTNTNTADGSNVFNFSLNEFADYINYIGTNNSQNIINNQNQNTSTINNNITNLNDSINNDNVTGNNSNDSITSISNTFSSSNDFILNLFTLPYNFITTIMNGVSNSCTPISLGTIFDYELVMPCINLNNWLGNVWTTIVDVVLAGMLSFAFRKRIHDFFFAVIRLDRNAANIGGVEIL